MARCKRPINHPDVIRERRLAAAAARVTAAASPTPYRAISRATASPSPPTSPALVTALRHLSQTPPRTPAYSTSTPPISPQSPAISTSTLFSAPALVDIEAAEISAGESTETPAAPRDPVFDLDEGRARNIYRVATQRERRQANPPRRRPRVYPCYPCARVFPSFRQRRAHEAGAPHRRTVAAAEYPKENLTCHVCERRFANGHDAGQHYSGTIHLRAIRKLRNSRK